MKHQKEREKKKRSGESREEKKGHLGFQKKPKAKNEHRRPKTKPQVAETEDQTRVRVFADGTTEREKKTCR